MALKLLLGVIGLVFSPFLYGLAQVESRTGEPVVKNQTIVRHIEPVRTGEPEPIAENSHSGYTIEEFPSDRGRSYEERGSQRRSSEYPRSRRTSEVYRESGRRESGRPRSQQEYQEMRRSQGGYQEVRRPQGGYQEYRRTQGEYPESRGTQVRDTGSPRGVEEQRAARLTFAKVDSLQREVSELRGLIEQQDYEIKLLKKNQQDLFKDLERRLSEVQSGKGHSKTADKKGKEGKSGDGKSGLSKEAQTTKNKSADSINFEVESMNSGSGSSSASSDPASSATSASQNISLQTPNSGNTTSGNTTKTSKDSKGSAKDSVYVPNAKDSQVSLAKTSNTTNQNTPISESNTKVSAQKQTPETLKGNIGIVLPKSPSGSADNSTSTRASTSASVSTSISNPTSTSTSNKIPQTQNLSEHESYQEAYQLVRTKRYTEAQAAFKEFLKHYPKGEQAPNAHYWLGEIYLLQWQGDRLQQENLEQASQEFSKLASQFPKHAKVQDAVLKLGLIELDKGNIELARQHLMEVKTRFPGTAAARIAESRLKEMSGME